MNPHRNTSLQKSCAVSHQAHTNPHTTIQIQCQNLTRPEEELLRQQEEIIANGLETFFKVGSALLGIRDARLYRGQYGTFAEYCQERWGFGRSYAWRVISAAERLKLLPPDQQTTKPTSEFQMRPFLKLAPEVFPSMWKQVLERAKNGRITSEIIGDLLEELNSSSRNKRNSTSRVKKVTFSKAKIGEIVMLLSKIRRQIDQNQSESAKADLDRIERLLFPPRQA